MIITVVMTDKNSTILVEDDVRVNRIMKIPPFWPEEPELWFAQLEGQFAICGVREDEARYAYVISKLEPRQAKEIKDVIINPPADHKYRAIKQALIQRLTDSQGQRIRQLLEHEELGDRKPSQFLRHLRTLAGTTLPDELLRTLWLGRLPTNMQAILATRTSDKLEDVAEQADRIHEIGGKSLVLATSTTTGKAPATTMEAQMETLCKQVAALTTQMETMQKDWKNGRGRQRARSRSGKRERSHSRSGKKPDESDGECFYHRRFGEKARKCTKPCTYAENKEGSH